MTATRMVFVSTLHVSVKIHGLDQIAALKLALTIVPDTVRVTTDRALAPKDSVVLDVNF
jgi:hypothetical protein